jgi:Mrp family chromosome partitioning ATPase
MHNSLNQAFIRAYAKEREAVHSQAVNHTADIQAEELILRIDTTNVDIPRPHLAAQQPTRQAVAVTASAVAAAQTPSPARRIRTAEEELRASIASEMLRAGGWQSEEIATLGPIATHAAFESSDRPFSKALVASVAEDAEPRQRDIGRQAAAEAPESGTAKFFTRDPATGQAPPDFMQHVKSGSIVRLDHPSTPAAPEKPETPAKPIRDRMEKPAEPIAEADAATPFAQTIPLHNSEQQKAAKSHTTAEVEQALRSAKFRVFSPIWEVDQLQWPEVCLKLMEARMDSLAHVTKHLTEACQEGLQVLAVTSPEGGEGRTTVACCLAMLAGSRGLKVAIVDGDIENPTLCLQTNLEIEDDWQSAILNQLPLEEIAVHSIDDQITLVPLLGPLDQTELPCGDQRIADMLIELAESFDLVILDIGHMNSPNGLMQSLAEQGIINAAIAVVDNRNASAMRIETCIRRIRQAGINSIGLVENFAA